MLTRIVAASLLASSMFVAVPTAATAKAVTAATPDCYLNCRWVVIRDENWNIIGGYWECPGEQADCVE